jgi:hypothetical protein
MIVKIKGRKTPTYQQLLNYIARDKDRLVDKQGQSFLLLHNVRGGGIDEWVKQFNVNEGFRLHKRRDNILLYHEIVSFHKADKVSLEILEDMAKEYIRLRNPNGSMWLFRITINLTCTFIFVFQAWNTALLNPCGFPKPPCGN